MIGPASPGSYFCGCWNPDDAFLSYGWLAEGRITQTKSDQKLRRGWGGRKGREVGEQGTGNGERGTRREREGVGVGVGVVNENASEMLSPQSITPPLHVTLYSAV